MTATTSIAVAVATRRQCHAEESVLYATPVDFVKVLVDTSEVTQLARYASRCDVNPLMGVLELGAPDLG